MSSINVGDLSASATLEDQLSSALEKIAKRLDITGVNFDDLTKKIDKTGTALNQAANVQTVLQTQLSLTKNNVDFLKSSLDTQAQIINRYGDRFGKLTEIMHTTSKEFLMAKSDVDGLKDSMAVLEKQFNTVAESAKITGSQIVSFGRGLQEGGIVLTTLVTAPLAAAGAEAIKTGIDFESASAKVVALAGASKEEVDSLSASVIGLAKSVGIGPAKLEEGLFVIESAGFRGAEAMKILEKTSKMAAVGMGTVEESTRAVVGAMLTFKEENLTAAKASDILVKTVQLGNMRVDELTGALGRINPFAAALGVKFADVNAAIATFTHLGASVDVAATGVSAVLRNIVNDSAKTEKGLKALNVKMSDVRKIIAEKGLTEALLFLVDAASKTTDGIDKLAQVFPNIRALVTVLADAKAQGKTFLDITEQIRAASGSLNEAFTTIEGTFAQQWKELTVSVEVLFMKIGNDLLPMLKSVVDFVSSNMLPVFGYLVDIFTNMPKPLQILAVGFTGFFAVLGPGLILLGEMVRSWGHLQVLFESEAVAKGISNLLPYLGQLKLALNTTELAATTAGKAIQAVSIVGTFTATGLSLWQFGTELGKLLEENFAREDAAARQAVVDARMMAEAIALVEGPVKNLDHAKKILDENAARLRDIGAAAAFVGPQLDGLGGSIDNMSRADALTTLEMKLLHTSIKNIEPDVTALIKGYFDAGYSAAEAFKVFKDGNLVMDEQKPLVEGLHREWTAHGKAVKELADAMIAADMAMVPLSKSQHDQAEELLKLGLGHKQVAENVGVHVAQIDALVKSDKVLNESMKIQEKAIDDLTKDWEKQVAATAQLGATDTERIKIKALEDYDIRVKKLQDAGVAETKYYDSAWALYQADVDAQGAALLLKDKNSKAYLVNELQTTKKHYQEMLAQPGQYTQAEKERVKEQIKNLTELRDQWGKLGTTIDKDKEKVRTLGGEVLTLKEYEARQLMGGSFDVTSANFGQAIQTAITSGGFNPTGQGFSGGTKEAYDLAKKGYSFDEIIRILSGAMGPGQIPPPHGPRIPGFITGGSGNFGSGTMAILHGEESIVPKGGGGSVVIEKIIMNYPIVNDRKSLNQLGRVMERSLATRLRNTGKRT